MISLVGPQELSSTVQCSAAPTANPHTCTRMTSREGILTVSPFYMGKLRHEEVKYFDQDHMTRLSHRKPGPKVPHAYMLLSSKYRKGLTCHPFAKPSLRERNKASNGTLPAGET